MTEARNGSTTEHYDYYYAKCRGLGFGKAQADFLAGMYLRDTGGGIISNPIAYVRADLGAALAFMSVASDGLLDDFGAHIRSLP